MGWILSVRRRNIMSEEKKFASWFSLGSIDNVRKKSGLSCSFIIFAALNIAMVAVGSNALDACPVDPMIPIYLVVAGSTSLILLVIRLIGSHVLIPQINKIDNSVHTLEGSNGNGNSKEPSQNMQLAVKAIRAFDTVASIFSTIWLIVGAYNVYSSYEFVNHHDLVNESFCDYTAYTFAFIVITIGFISLVLSVIAALCACI